jgi:KipI family sensor histidine kinase inhibitor
MTTDVQRYGPVGLLLRPTTSSPATVASWIRETFGEQVREVVPGATTVVVEFHDRLTCTQVQAQLRVIAEDLVVPKRFVRETLICPVTFDGPDVEEVADRVNLCVADLVQMLTSADLQVAFCGFAPGFGYLTGLPELLHLPRRATPRTRVEPGSVAIAAGYAAIYPAASPGGWHLLGRCDLPLWDLSNDPPALMTPGRQVRFVARAHPRVEAPK